VRGLHITKGSGGFYQEIMNELNTKTIKEIALENPVTVRVFQEYKIDFCCGGKRLFNEACAVAGVDSQAVAAKIFAALNNETNQIFPESRSASDLIDYILETHHVFTRAEIERLTTLLNKVATRHGESHRELFLLQRTFQELCSELSPHMQKEERVLFPYIKHLENSSKASLSSPRPPFGSVNNPVQMMINEHDAAGDLLRKMRKITQNYTLPEGACMSYRALFFGFEELEKDLHQHIHLENNVLFPQAIELERAVFAAAN
jgi:regulator of cell morphogenesis and NO signaling